MHVSVYNSLRFGGNVRDWRKFRWWLTYMVFRCGLDIYRSITDIKVILFNLRCFGIILSFYMGLVRRDCWIAYLAQNYHTPTSKNEMGSEKCIAEAKIIFPITYYIVGIVTEQS